MCTAFVRRGRDVITGFNFDMSVDGMDYVPVIEQGRIGVGMRLPKEVMASLPPSVTMTNNVRLIQGVSAGGHVAGQLCNMDFDKVPQTYAEGMLTIDQLTDSFVTEHQDAGQLLAELAVRDAVNLPGVPTTPAVSRPPALHSLFVDPTGNTVFVEPGNGYAVIREKYFVVTNFALLELPMDLNEDRFGYYGVDRYRTALRGLKESTDEFGAADGLRLLREVRQTGTWGTRFSFVYSRNENAVYYCLEGDFDHVQRYAFDA